MRGLSFCVPQWISERSYIMPEKPTDIKRWWRAACCGPETHDATLGCAFCEMTVYDCAVESSRIIKAGNGSVVFSGDGEQPACMGSGFWCGQCGRFWPQDSCGN